MQRLKTQQRETRAYVKRKLKQRLRTQLKCEFANEQQETNPN